MKACKNCKWWSKLPLSASISKLPMGVCWFAENENLFMYVKDGERHLYTRAEFYCKGWQKKEKK